MRWNKKQWLSESPYRLGTYVQTSDSAIIEILANAGFDFVVLDGEHAPLSMESIKNLIVAAKSADIVAFVRVRQNQSELIMSPLDAGAPGVQIPQISTFLAAQKAIQAAKYHPKGSRGSNPYVRATGYGATTYTDYMEWANANTLLILQVEGIEGINNIDHILETPELDVIWIGPYDLSQSMGLPGQVNHPQVRSKMKTVLDKANACGIAGGTFADGIDAAKNWIALGMRLVAVSYETKMLYERAHEIVHGIKTEN